MDRVISISDLIENQAVQQPDSPAVLGINNKPCTYQKLYDQIQYTVAYLNSIGISRNDPVAIVLPNGPIMATAFLSIASGATSAPLNPAYTTSEFEFYLSDLNAKALIVQTDSTSDAIKVAKILDIPIIHLEPLADIAEGLFSLNAADQSAVYKPPEYSKSNDVALILHTSGTTHKPKMVPLTQKNVIISAENISKTLNLGQDDRCLNVMPLFHIHGLMAAVLATITAGGSIVCTPGFYAPQFFKWVNTFKPTWYSAVPTIHQAVLKKAEDNLDIINSSKLRFIRSSSSSLAPHVMEDLEKCFGVPVIEAYGMTEAAHQMASNPLPPGTRKPGSVGHPAGPKIEIMAEDHDKILPSNTVGEIVIRGDNVTLGYMNNPDANQKSFTKGWFRTGDQGMIDEDGYLFITGRLKEIINRGGEKISPREIDEALLSHPEVAQAVAFGIPDESLGEDIAAAVILKNQTLSERDLKVYLSDKVAAHKIPKYILLVEDIPKGSTGKIQRIGMAEKLGFSQNLTGDVQKESDFVPPETSVEKTIFSIWQNILDLDTIGIHHQFRELGGDSMLATLIHQEIENGFGIIVPLVDVFSASTISEQANLIEKRLHDKQPPK